MSVARLDPCLLGYLGCQLKKHGECAVVDIKDNGIYTSPPCPLIPLLRFVNLNGILSYENLGP